MTPSRSDTAIEPVAGRIRGPAVAPPGAGGMIVQPVFLVGSERSGTTLTRLMLDHHPQIAFFFEFEYAVDWMPDSGGWPDLDAYFNSLEMDRTFQMAELTIDRSL